MKKIAISLATCVLFQSSAFGAVPNDFDADGVSDRTWIQIESDKTLTWNAHLSSSDTQSALGSLGKAGDAVTMAQWLSGGTQIGVASLNTTTNDIEWSIRDGSGNVIKKTLGKKGDLVISGADFDGNGLADAAVARLDGQKVMWIIKLDFFASATPIEKTVEFGAAGDRLFYARAEAGSAVDWIGVTRTGTNGRTLARMKDVNSDAIKQFERLPKFASQGSRPRPFPIRQASGPDLLGFIAGAGGKTTVRVFSFTGRAYASNVFNGLGTSVVGEFLQGPGYEVAYEAGEDAEIMNPRTIDVTETVPYGGVPVDEINVNTLGATVVTPTPTSTPTGGGGGGGGGGDVSRQCGTIVPWPSSHIYKTVGSKHFSDVRKNTIGVIIKPGGSGPFPSCIDAIDTKGNSVAKLGLYAMGAGWEARYYAGIGCGRGTPYGGAAVAQRAQQGAGSIRIYAKFNNVCYGPIDANRCRNSTSCS